MNSINDIVEISVSQFDEWLKKSKFDLGMLVSLKKLVEAEWIRAEKIVKDTLKVISKDTNNESINKLFKDVSTLSQILEDRATVLEVYIKENKEENTN
jgi:hypothetical protein